MKMVVVVEYEVAEEGAEQLLHETMEHIGPGLQGPALRGFHVAITEAADAVLAAMKHTRGGEPMTPVEPDAPEDEPTPDNDD